MEVVNKGGRPKSFNSVNELETAIRYYFDSISKTELVFESVCTGYEDEGKKKPIIGKVPVLNNAGEQVKKTTYFENPSIIGMCVHMGVHRDTLCEYEKKAGYSDTIKRAKFKVEWFLEDQLYRKDQVAGVIFNLKNNFGWHDIKEVESTLDVRIPMIEEVRNTFAKARQIHSIDILDIEA